MKRLKIASINEGKVRNPSRVADEMMKVVDEVMCRMAVAMVEVVHRTTRPVSMSR